MGLKAFFLVMAVVITISVIILAGMTANYNKTQGNIDKRLVALDADIAGEVDACSNQYLDSGTKAQCNTALMGVHDNECKTYPDKLSSCGKIDSYLKGVGLI